MFSVKVEAQIKASQTVHRLLMCQRKSIYQNSQILLNYLTKISYY